jgi:riboflavin kinase/FMN adenylyltransferase
MLIHQNGSKLPTIPYAIVTPGMFDGVHQGHMSLLKKLVVLAKERNGQTVLLTYWPHPRTVLQPEKPPIPLLTTLDEKLELFEQAGIDHVVIQPFTEAFSKMHADDFVQHILIENLQTKLLIVGYDHHFGNNREGNYQYLLDNRYRFGFELLEIPATIIDEMAVSSTKIRYALQASNIEAVKHFLGRSYCLNGTVVMGNQRGRTIGFPTANLQLTDENKLTPGDGVYAVWVELRQQRWMGMMNIGFRPTVQGRSRTIEVHIIDFQGDIYGETLRVHVEHFLRAEKPFPSLEDLKMQLRQDLISTRQLFS